MSRPVNVHTYLDDGTRDHRDQGRCIDCGTPRENERHAVPDTAAATAAHDRRYVPEEDS